MAALENLDPAVRIEGILDGRDIEPATRLEYFLKKAAEGGGGSGSVIHIVKATGEVNVESAEGSDIVTMNSDVDEDTIYDWLNSCEPVYCAAPMVNIEDETTWVYGYDEVSMDLVRQINSVVEMKPNSGATSLTFDPSGVFTWTIPGRN